MLYHSILIVLSVLWYYLQLCCVIINNVQSKTFPSYTNTVISRFTLCFHYDGRPFKENLRFYILPLQPKRRLPQTDILTFWGNFRVSATWIWAVHNLHYGGRRRAGTGLSAKWNTSLWSQHKYALRIYCCQEKRLHFRTKRLIVLHRINDLWKMRFGVAAVSAENTKTG